MCGSPPTQYVTPCMSYNSPAPCSTTQSAGRCQARIQVTPNTPVTVVLGPIPRALRRRVRAALRSELTTRLGTAKENKLVEGLAYACHHASFLVPARRRGRGRPPDTWLPILLSDVDMALIDAKMGHGAWLDEVTGKESTLYALVRICARMCGNSLNDQYLRRAARNSRRIGRRRWIGL